MKRPSCLWLVLTAAVLTTMPPRLLCPWASGQIEHSLPFYSTNAEGLVSFHVFLLRKNSEGTATILPCWKPCTRNTNNIVFVCGDEKETEIPKRLIEDSGSVTNSERFMPIICPGISNRLHLEEWKP